MLGIILFEGFDIIYNALKIGAVLSGDIIKGGKTMFVSLWSGTTDEPYQDVESGRYTQEAMMIRLEYLENKIRQLEEEQKERQ